MNNIYIIDDKIEFHVKLRLVKNSKSHKEVRLTLIGSELLLALCQNANIILSHPLLMEFAWGEKHNEVQYGTYYQTLLMLRKALREAGESRGVIKTIPRKGLILKCSVIEHSEHFKSKLKTDKKSSYSIFSSKLKIYNILIDNKKTIFNSILWSTSIILISSAFLYHLFIDEENIFFSSYIKSGELDNHCIYYFNKDVNNHSRHNLFIKDNLLICKPNTYLFITAYSTTRQVSAMRCSFDPISKAESGNCITYYFPSYMQK